MKKLFTFLATFALFAGMANAQQVRTIGSMQGYDESIYAPFYNDLDEGYVQMIYDAASLNMPGGATITALEFNCASVETGMDPDHITIYMGHTDITQYDDENATGWVDGISWTTVFDDDVTQPTVTGWFKFDFSTPFEYNGVDNIVIAVVRQGSSDAPSQLYYYTVNEDENLYNVLSLATTDHPAEDDVADYVLNFLPDIRLTCDIHPACFAVQSLSVTETTTNSAIFSIDGDPASIPVQYYTFEYGLSGFEEGTGTTVNINDGEQYRISGLEAAKWYDVYVTSHCTNGSSSHSKKITFHTELAPLSLPYSFAFVSGQNTGYTQSTYSVDNEKPLGWDYPGQAAAVSQVWLTTSGAFALRTNNTAPSVLVMPELDADLRKVVLNFNTPTVGIEYGYWYSDAFTSLGTATSGANSIDLEDLGANIPAGARLAFSYTGSSASMSEKSINAISVEDAPSCKVPSGITLDATTLTTTGFTMRWGGVQNEGDKYHVVLRNSNNYSISTNIVAEAENLTDQFYTFSGLDTATNYYFTVSKVCATEGETEAARLPGMATTHYAVRTAVNNGAMGSVVGQASGVLNSDITITAVPKPGYEFVNWTVLNRDGVEQSGHPTDAELDLTLNGSTKLYTYKANFQEQQFTLTVNTDPADITTTYGGGVKNYGASVPVYVESAAGYDFVGWSDGAESTVDGSYIRHTGNVSVKENKTVTAYFVAEGSTQKRIVASVSDEAAGSIVGATGTGLVEAGTAISIGHTTNPGYTFNGWYVNGSFSSAADTWTGTADGHKTIVAKYTRNSYAVTIASNDESVGTVAGATSGTYEHGTVLTLVPNTASSKIHFREWRDEGGLSLGSNVPFNVTVEAAKTYTAIFYKDSINVSVERNMAQGGTVHLETMGGTNLGGNTMVAVDDQVKLVAELADHYHFGGWKIGTQSYGSSETTVYTASGTTAKTFTAQFAIDERTLTVSSADDEMGTVSVTASGAAAAASGSYGYGTAMSLTAQPRSHYSFTGWYNGDALVSTQNPYTFDLNDNTTLEARFAIDQHTLALAVKAGQSSYGSVNSAAVDGTYDYGTTKEIVATPNTGYDFVEWEEDHNTNASRTVRIEANATYTAVFAQHEYNVNITSSNVAMGTVALDQDAPYHYGDAVTATATVTDADAYKFIGWSDNQQNNVTSRTFTINADLTVTAIFTDADKWSVFVQSNNNSVGEVSSDATSVLNGTSVNITATATDPNYEFTGWSDGVMTANRTITVTSDTILTANFGPKGYDIAISAGEGGSLHASSAVSGNYAYGTTLTLKAVADEANHYHFVQWNDGNQMAERVVTVSGTATYAAEFALDNYAVSVIVDNGGTYTVTPSGTNFDHGSIITIEATAATDYRITGWTMNGVDYTPTTSLGVTTLTVTEGAAFRVFTAKVQYQLNVTSENNNKGFIEGAANGWYDFDQNVTVTATPADNYDFVNWNNNPALDNPVLNLTMDENQTYVAYFKLKSYNVQVAAGANGQLTYSINNGAEQNGNINDTYDHGTQITLHAEATTPGYEFDQWSDGGSVNATRTIVVGSAVNISATFKPSAYVLTLSVNEPTMGSISYVSEEKATYAYDENVTIRANVSNTNLYKFLSWNDGDTHMVRVVKMRSDVDMKALFGRLDMLTVNALSNNNAWGTVVSSATSVNLNDEVTLTATPAEHYHLVGWSDIEGYNTDLVRNDVHITSDTIITAIFAIDTFNIDIAMTANGASVSGIGSYTYGSSVSIYAEAEEHAHFMYWSGDANGTANPMTVTVNDDMNIVANFERDMVRIQAMAQNGSVSRADTNVYYGEGFALTATADEHYSNFKGWTRNGVAVEGAETITVDATSDAIYQAVFAIDSFMLSVDVNDPTMGSVNGPISGKYPYGTVMLFVAVPANHYHFEGWTGDFEAPETLIGFEMTQDYDILASFAINTHQLTVGIEDGDEELGTVNSAVSGTYAYGTSIDVTAAPNDGFSFTRWSDGQTAATRTITMGENDINIKADFDTIYYNVNVVVNNDTMGEILGAQDAYVWHDVVTFTAHNFDTNRFKFIGWSDGQHGLDTVRTETIEGDLNLTAIFTDKEKLSVYVQSNNQAWGTAAASENSVNINHTVTLTATAAADHHFVAWMNGEDTVSTDAEYIFAVTENVNYTAIFATDRHQVILANEDGHAVALTGSGEYDWNETVVISAEAEEHYEFVNWTDENGNEVGNSNPYTFAMQSADTTIVANFQLKTYTLTLVAGNGGSVEGAGDYTALDYATITATAAHNYTFGAWMKDGDTVSTDTSVNVQMLGDATYTASFVEDPLYTIALQSENLSMGTVNSVAATHEGDEVNIVATPKNHYHFVKWVDANDTSVVFGTEQDTTFVASENLNLVAMFHIDMVALTLQSDGNGELTGAGEYEYGQTVVLGNEPAEHYHLNKWYSEGNDSIASTPTLSVRVVSDTTIHADFVLNTYTITVNAENGHNAIGSGSYTAHDFVTISAEANDNYHFYSWRKNGLDIAGGEELEIEVLGNDTYTAVYSENDAFRVYVQSANLSQGTVEGNAAYHVDNVATVKATPKEHHHFMNWTNNAGEVLSTEAEFSFVVESDTTLTANFAIDTHHVVLTNNLDSNIGEGDFPYGASVSFNAGTPEGYHFMRFENEQGDTMSLENPMLLNIVCDTAVVIVYNIDTLDVTLVAENGEIETDTLRYIWGSEATFTAVAAERYHFAGWSNGETDNPITVNLYSDTTVSAVFEKDQQHITIVDEMYGETWEYDFPWGTYLNLGYTEYEHYHFMGFYDENGNLIGMDNPTAYYFDTTITIHATYAIDTHEVTLVAENGTIFYDTLRYTYGATAEFTYEPAENYHFVGWMVDGVDAGNADTLSFSVEGDAVVEALFSIDSYSFTVSSNDMAKGYVTGTQNGTYDNGDAIEVVAHANQYNVFVGWMSGEDTISTNDTLGFNIVSDTAITAVFASELFSINAEANDTAMGSVEGTGMFTFHSLATLTAVPAEGHHFVMWSDSLTTVSRMIYVEQDTNLVAYFAIDTHYVAVVVNDTAMGSVTGEGWYNWGDTVTLKATPNAHFNFLGFNGSTNHIDSISFVVTEDVTVTANFDYQYLKIYSSFENGNVGIEVAGVQANTNTMPVIAHYGDSIVMTATANEHYHFVNWVEYSLSYDTTMTIDTTYITESTTEMDPTTGEAITIVDTLETVIDTNMVVTPVYTADTTYDDAQIGYRIYNDRYIDAVFEINEVTLQLLGMHAELIGAGTYNAGDSVTVSATVEDHYVFIGWSDGTTDTIGGAQNIIDSNLSYTFVIEEDMVLWAITEGELVTVTLSASPEAGGVVIGEGTYHYGDVVSISADANEGYTFENWTRGDGVTITTAEYSFTVVEDVAFVANFHKVGIDNVDQTDISVYAYGDVIYVKGAENQTIRIYDAVGRMVSSSMADGEDVKVRMEASGIYMVQVGNNRAQRVMIVR